MTCWDWQHEFICIISCLVLCLLHLLPWLAVFVYGLVLPPLDAAVEAVRSALGPGQGIDAVKVTMQMANK